MDKKLEVARQFLWVQGEGPQVLYKFRPSTSFDATLDFTFRRRSLYLASPEKFPDDCDMKPRSHPSTSAEESAYYDEVASTFPSEVREETRRFLPEVVPPAEVNRQFHAGLRDQILSPHGVCCFTANASSPVIWETHAGQHTGFAVAYRPSRIGRLFHPIFRVEYVPAAPTVSAFNKATRDLSAVLRQKRAQFEWEEEWRTVRRRAVGPVEVPIGAIAGVLLGADMVPAHRAALRDAARRLAEEPAVLQATSRGPERMSFERVQ